MEEQLEITKTDGGAPPPETKPAPKPEEEVSSKFAALAKKDKAISRRAQEIAAKEQAIKEREAKLTQEANKLEELRNKARLNPVEAMRELGLSYEQVTEFILNKEKPTADSKLEALRHELESFRKEAQEERKKTQEEVKTYKQQQETQVLDGFKGSINEFIQSKPEEYELLNELDRKGLINAKELIFSGIQMVHRDKGVIPTIKEAADGVQSYLLGEIEALLSSVKHFKTKYQPLEEKLLTPEGTPATTTTLSNSMTSSVATNLPAATEEERIRRAIQAMERAGG